MTTGLIVWAAFLAALAVLLLILLTVRHPARLAPVWVALIILTPVALGGYS
jgi:hypothetical protein